MDVGFSHQSSSSTKFTAIEALWGNKMAPPTELGAPRNRPKIMLVLAGWHDEGI